MSWRDRLRPASFRGVGFYTFDRRDYESGRRVQLHQYPFRDLPYAEDLGLQAGQFRVDCLLIGRDYDLQRDQLEAALKQPGPGTLVLPTRGAARVVVLNFRSSESTSEGGVCRISVTFAEAGERIEPAASADTAAAVDAAAAAALEAAQADFAEDFETRGLPQWVADAAQSNVMGLANQVDAISQSVPGIPEEVLAFRESLNALSNGVAALIRAPIDLAADVAGLVGGLGRLVQRPLDAIAMYRRLFGAGEDADSKRGDTPTRRQQVDNQNAVNSLFRRTAVIEAARQSAAARFAAGEDAMALRDELAEQLDQLATSATDPVYQALTDLRVAVVQDLATRGATLPRLGQYMPLETLPAVVVAYQVHGDARREGELVARNRIRHPGFVPGGVALEVLHG